MKNRIYTIEEYCLLGSSFELTLIFQVNIFNAAYKDYQQNTTFAVP